jgi:hypothetical protein
MSAEIKPRPQHKMADVNVGVPTVIDRELEFEGQIIKSVFIQWFAEPTSPHIPKGAQFFFSTLVPLNDPMWMNNPDSFQVVYIGPIKYWPEPTAVKELLKLIKGTPDTTIVWLMSPRGPVHLEPSSPFLAMTVLGDPVCGIIKPRLYYDVAVRDAVMKKIEDSMSLGDKLARDWHMELPPEEIPWTEGKGECSCLKTLNGCRPRKQDASTANCNSDDLAYICTLCGRRWWQYNTHFHLWKHVTNPNEWDSVRRQHHFIKAGYEFPEQ